MINIKDRVRNKELHAKIVSAEEAAASIKDGMNIATSGFTPAGYPKAVPLALAKRMEQEKFKVNLWTGASVGKELDGALAEVKGIAKRLPYQTNNAMRTAINNGEIQYTDLHLSHVAQMSRYGFFGGKVDVAIVEACAITEEGHIIPTTSVGNAASFVQSADFVIVEVNTSQPLELEGMHDIYVPLDPPHRQPIPLVKVDDRIGTPYIPCGVDRIAYIVPCDIKDDARPLAAIDDDARAMTGHLIDFLKQEIKAGRMPKNLLPLQSGVGSVANAVVAGLANSDFEDLTVYTEVIQDGMFDLIDAGKLTFASGTSITASPDGLKRLYANISEYRKRILLRPQEIANSPEIARRIGVIAMNTAIEFDLYGHVNSSHIMGTKMMNGIGGSGDFSRNAYLTIFFSSSVAKKGDISSIVPMCSHFDHTEHDIDVFITERGVADVRGLSPKERARVIINNCAHPDYQPMLLDYFERAVKATGYAHTPHIISEALSWHTRFLETGSMKIK
ncbi:acetyl-CoA hydrolase/transferase family protein [Sporomusa acidovorans]|uniref:Succinyl-CoA:coenzyme A transferase n=1 Tax=Sporomusa acidovorans (strain ATCC 49682 / DSM 3132 / Mol) TaxID=1123286 RepID=A0ABZ3J0N9_SPOA4|nr:acetyl-CoA hydrolase/transferase family protein [Sporomusa acidovorans]OZC22481.1 succinyl-CoA:coenzyme A transferase [Sporomusa acidovorans DSM 3132]SDE73851.1 succinyl-CoA:acetate CoA-transferase [Sporomusa acidovorans]